MLELQKNEPMDNINLKIIEAIKIIASDTGYQVSYDVGHVIEKRPFRKSGIKKILVSITLEKQA